VVGGGQVPLGKYSPGALDKPPGILQQQQQQIFPQRRGNQAKAEIEKPGFLIQRMDQQRPYPGLFGDQEGAADGILQQTGADPLPLILAVHRQAGQ
jgi:hypothetical protein